MKRVVTMNLKTKEILVILPAFNEEAVIGDFLDKLTEYKINEIADVFVINDGSTDATSMIVKEKGYNIISHIYNLGYGCALQTGYKYAVRNHYNYVVQIDSDGQHDVKNITNLISTLKADPEADIVIGSRFLEGSQTFHVNAVKMVAIKMFRKLIKKSAHQEVLDPTSGLQVLSRRAFMYYSFYNNFVSDYPDANMIIQMSLNNFKIREIPAIMHIRETGVSMHSGLKPFIYMIKMTLQILVIIIREKRNKKEGKVG
jgi:glycosyltransferase involved in cell wall biosynthesis